MKLITVKNEIKTEKRFPGLISCDFTHEIKSARAVTEYLGPVISPEVWHQVLAFFQWTYDTTKSESQVRLFVNPSRLCWQAWAFPQEARTGMTARELDTPAKAEQRAQFSDSEGWIYFGTVHHHCSASAFQSGTDKANEEHQDGLHITVGNMASARYDLHARFYLGGFGFEPDLSKFWDVGPVVKDAVAPAVWDLCARHQMGAKAPANTEYPALWKENLIEVRSTFPVQTSTSQGSYPGYYAGAGYDRRFGPSTDKEDLAVWLRAKKAVGELSTYLKTEANLMISYEQTEELIGNTLQDLAEGKSEESDMMAKICELCCSWKVTPMQMWTEIPHDGKLKMCEESYDLYRGDPVKKQGTLTQADLKQIQDADDQNHNMYGHKVMD